MRSPAFVVGAYASHPAEPQAQDDYLRALAATGWVDGLELPYPGALADPAGRARLATTLTPGWGSQVTAIPGTMQLLGQDPDFGLASPDTGGRKRALAFTRQLRDAVDELCSLRGERVITRVQVHSAPTRRASAQALSRSLASCLEWDWQGVELVVEHCDAWTLEHQVEKGFLALEDEISVVADLGLRLHLNWGRCVLDARHAARGLEDIVRVRESGVLAGVIFSGVGPEPSLYGAAWSDGHLPSSTDEPTSLMSPQVISECAKAAVAPTPGGLGADYLGAKICVPPQASLDTRVAMLATIARACSVRERP